jgi:hypothetical protein
LRLIAAACFAIAGVTVASGSSSPATDLHPAQLTRDQDHQRLKELLHITQLRRGPDGDPTSFGSIFSRR